KESGEWSVVDQVAVAAHDVSEARKDILDIIKIGGPAMSAKQIATWLGKSLESVRKVIGRMVSEGLLHKTGTHSDVRYSITPLDEPEYSGVEGPPPV
ncbi:MAG: winged helix-turn-helix domain-containing protein, partial [Magnetococcus sp. XQGC-1]